MKIKAFLFFILILAVFSELSLSAWFNDSYPYRREINLSYPSTINDVQVLIQINYSSNMSPDFSGIMFTYLNGSNEIEVPFWIEEAVSSSYALIWVRVPRLSTTERLYMYYGNSSLPNKSNGFDTFFMFDDFDLNSLNLSIWTADPGLIIQFSSGNFVSNQGLGMAALANVNVLNGYVSETRAKLNAFGSYYSGVFATPMSSLYTAPNNANADSTMLYMTASGGSGTLSHWVGNGCAASYNVHTGILPYTLTLGQYYVFSTEVTPSGGATAIRFLINRQNLLETDTSSFCKPLSYIRVGFFHQFTPGANTEVYYDWVLVRKYYNLSLLNYVVGEEESIKPLSIAIISPPSGSFVGAPFNVVLNLTSYSFADVELYLDGVLTTTWFNVANTTLSTSLSPSIGNHTITAIARIGNDSASDSISVIVLQNLPPQGNGDDITIIYNNTIYNNATNITYVSIINGNNMSGDVFPPFPQNLSPSNTTFILNYYRQPNEVDYGKLEDLLNAIIILLSLLVALLLFAIALLVILVLRREAKNAREAQRRGKEQKKKPSETRRNKRNKRRKK